MPYQWRNMGPISVLDAESETDRLFPEEHAQLAYQHADKAIHHYQRLIAAHLSPAQRRAARLALIRVVFLRAAARRQMESEVTADEMVAA